MEKIFTRDYHTERIQNHWGVLLAVTLLPVSVCFSLFLVFGQLFVKLNNSFSPTLALIILLVICCVVLGIILLVVGWFVYDSNQLKKQYAGQLNEKPMTGQFDIVSKKITYSRASYNAFNPKQSARYYIFASDNTRLKVSREMFENISEGMRVEVSYYKEDNFVITLKIVKQVQDNSQVL